MSFFDSISSLPGAGTKLSSGDNYIGALNDVSAEVVPRHGDSVQRVMAVVCGQGAVVRREIVRSLTVELVGSVGGHSPHPLARIALHDPRTHEHWIDFAT